MMDEAAFLQKIISEPDNDLPRLIYADWLEEQGNPRAEFIRVQCELARGDVGDKRRNELLRRERKLLSQHRQDWLPQIQGKLQHFEFLRGFLEAAALNISVLLDEGASLFLQTPLRQVTLISGNNRFDELLQCEHLKQIRVLVFDLNSILHTAGRLGECPYLTNLETLIVGANDYFDTADLSRLCSAGAFPQLKTLDIPWGDFQQGLDPLFTGMPFPELEHLRLFRAAESCNPFPLLARSPQYAGLKSLAVTSHVDGRVDPSPICNCDHLQKLEELRLEGSDSLLMASLPRLLASDRFPSLQHLSLNNTHVTTVELALLAKSPLLGQLETLDLRLCFGIQNRSDVLQLIDSPYWNGRTQLNLVSTNLKVQSRKALQKEFGKTFGNLHLWRESKRSRR